jgi:hypothetical protein
MAVASTWRTADQRWLVDLIVDEPGKAACVWDEGELAAELGTLAELARWMLEHAGAAVADLREVPVDDPWCE